MEINLAEIIELIEQLAGEDECHLDHIGYCQEHLWFYLDVECPHKRARKLLEAVGNNDFTFEL